MAHTYKARDGRVLPSVTTVIGAMMPNTFKFWELACKKKGLNPDEELVKRGNIGTICHYRVLSKVSPVPIDVPDIPIKKYPTDAELYADSFEYMWDGLKLKIEHPVCEKFNFNEELGFCGTYDLFGRVSGVIKDKRPEGRGRNIVLDGNKCLIDLKTSVAARDTFYHQLGAYSLFAPEPPDYGIVICMHPFIEKNRYLLAKCYVLDKQELERYKDEFLDLLKDWWRIHGRSQK